jgi:hypothetical protein
MPSAQQTPFHYHASAFALSGHLKRPVEHLIEVQGGTTLPTSGGHGSAHVENFRFDHAVSFKAGYAHVSGSEKVEGNKTIHTTLSTSVVEGLNVLDVVTADRIVARLASSFEPGSAESSILLLGSRFENLRVAGCKIDVELDHELAMKLDTFEAARNEFKKSAEFRKMTADPFDSSKVQKKVEAHGKICCSFVKDLSSSNCPGVKHHGHNGYVLEVPEFGKIYLAEVKLEHGRKTLTMLRVELGSPNGGGVVAAEATTNGRPPGGSG